MEQLRWLLLHWQNLQSHGIIIHDHIFFMARGLIRLSQQKSCSKYEKSCSKIFDSVIIDKLLHDCDPICDVFIFGKNKTEYCRLSDIS